jgi:hypothetical protein
MLDHVAFGFSSPDMPPFSRSQGRPSTAASSDMFAQLDQQISIW